MFISNQNNIRTIVLILILFIVIVIGIEEKNHEINNDISIDRIIINLLKSELVLQVEQIKNIFMKMYM